MRMCQLHWDALKAAISERGLGRFVAQSGQVVINRLTTEAQTPQESFEPLMGASLAILSNALRRVGVEVMRQNDDGTHRCPMCYLIDTCPCGRSDECPVRSFITKAADEQLTYARELKLIPEAS